MSLPAATVSEAASRRPGRSPLLLFHTGRPPPLPDPLLDPPASLRGPGRRPMSAALAASLAREFVVEHGAVLAD